MSELNDERPPVFKQWRTWYALVLGALIIQIIIYLVITLTLS
jgi:hypothetical protein